MSEKKRGGEGGRYTRQMLRGKEIGLFSLREDRIGCLFLKEL